MWNINKERLNDALFTKRWVIDLINGQPEQLITLLKRAAPHIPADEWDKRINVGGAHLNGAPVAGDCIVAPPARVEYFEPRGGTFESSGYPLWSSDWIIFEDNDLIVINKPIHLPTLPVREQSIHNLRRYLEEYLVHAVHLPSRLDTSTSGLVIASKSPDTHRALQRTFETRAIVKRYLCELSGVPSFRKLTLSSAIGHHPLHPVLRATHSAGKSALTCFNVIEPREKSALVEARPITGRTHQIRVHAQAMGYPLVGDNFYNGAEAPSLHLCCVELGLNHPRTGAALRISLPEKARPSWIRSEEGAQIAS